eukprot:992157_1
MALSHNPTGHDAAQAAAYDRTNSPIFAPFMIHVVCNLLNQSKARNEPPINVETQIRSWGGGLKQLRSCYSLWDQRVREACQTTPIDHPIWNRFIEHHRQTPHTYNIQRTSSMLEALLQIWCRNGEQNSTYGPYPTPYEQQQYQNECLLPIGHLSAAIMNFEFERSFKANRADVDTLLSQKQRQVIATTKDEKELKNDTFIDPMNPSEVKKKPTNRKRKAPDDSDSKEETTKGQPPKKKQRHNNPST